MVINQHVPGCNRIDTRASQLSKVKDFNSLICMWEPPGNFSNEFFVKIFFYVSSDFIL